MIYKNYQGVPIQQLQNLLHATIKSYIHTLPVRKLELKTDKNTFLKKNENKKTPMC